ncbi:putative isomerase YbhE [Aaosphaeria arxii CBS 175.79]|uniref:Putative isomerase YbhE n=1 Tax=Aaosphaeria arxii CBS 175.79 TaxID=1450172 RepID=A0A6A5XLX2_9PLEO|nr:putative isomerase YbhE [Aaosphaeria arxii CBS 175.79]KAF2014258.1 putative isomerase YbhE [Aaosphaeria arxii CBS 175.79]
MHSHKLLLSGDRANFTIIEFNSTGKEISILAEYPSPYNASWIEVASSHGNISNLVGLSEGEDVGLLYTFQIDHAHKTCQITSQQPTLGAPGHFLTLRDNSALVLGTYLGGSIAVYPIEITDDHSPLLSDEPRTEIFPEFPYRDVGHGPNKARQQQCHVHQILDGRGTLYAPDLGSDRVWIIRRSGSVQVDITGWLQCPPGTGARHAVIVPDNQIMYVIGELSHNVVAFDLSTILPGANLPIEDFAPHVIPQNVHPDHQLMMDSSEICLHPKIPNVLYVSNRWERHVLRREPHLKNVPKDLPPGDAIAVILLSSCGRKVEEKKYIRTNVDVIRGMRLSNDGRYMAVVGQEGGGVEIYEIEGDRGDLWTKIAGLNNDLENGLKHVIWL